MAETPHLGNGPAVCLMHGRFVPCRKKGEHQISTAPEDIAKVQFHMEVSVRDQQAKWKTPEYEEDTILPEDAPLEIMDEYGTSVLACGSMVLTSPAHGGVQMLTGCRESFYCGTLTELIRDVTGHYASVKHYKFKQEGISK